MRCMWHQEATASLVQRKDGWYCYGSCRKLYTHKEVEDRTGEHYEYEEEEREPEDLGEAFKYIKSLPLEEVRGLRLPADERGYFITWPSDGYYKYRLYDPGKGPKYIGPRGRKPPMFWARKRGSATLLIAEGEINALSFAKAFEEYDVCSPGSASMFSSESLSFHLPEFKAYGNVLVVLDDDPAGIKAQIETKALFLYKVPFVSFIRMKEDANHVLCESGPKALRERLQGSSHQ